MIEEYVKYKINKFFDNKKLYISFRNNVVYIKETDVEGKADLSCIMLNDSIIVNNPDKNILPYLRQGQAQQCSDEFIFSKVDKKYIIRIIELKKTINQNSLKKAIKQIAMGIYYSKALIAFLGINETDVLKFEAYIAYREDKLSCVDESIKQLKDEGLISLHEANSNKNIEKYFKLQKMWLDNILKLTINMQENDIAFKKLQLDSEGKGFSII